MAAQLETAAGMTATQKRAELEKLLSEMAAHFELPLMLRTLLPQLFKKFDPADIDKTLQILVKTADNLGDACEAILDGDAATLAEAKRDFFS